MVSFLAELRRRNDCRLAAVCAILGWLPVQVADTALCLSFGALSRPLQAFTFLVIPGFPLVLIFPWAYQPASEATKGVHLRADLAKGGLTGVR